MKIDILLCLIAHQLQRLARCLLLGFFFASSAAFANNIAIQMDFDGKMLVMIRTAFSGENRVRRSMLARRHAR